MDHSKMDHGNMGHGDVGDMPMPMPEMCSMNMLFNWDTDNLCIIFRSWHIKSPLSLFISLLAIVALVAGYELFRAAVHRYALRAKQRVELLPNTSTETVPLLGIGQAKGLTSRRGHMVKAVLYALQTFYAFMIMLIFMTYNGYVMGAVTVGAFVGYLMFGGYCPIERETACH